MSADNVWNVNMTETSFYIIVTSPLILISCIVLPLCFYDGMTMFCMTACFVVNSIMIFK